MTEPESGRRERARPPARAPQHRDPRTARREDARQPQHRGGEAPRESALRGADALRRSDQVAGLLADGLRSPAARCASADSRVGLLADGAAPAWWLAPAKLNLGLRVVGRRDDGYHLLESLFVPLDLADRVRVEAEAAAATSVSMTMLGRAGDVPVGRRQPGRARRPGLSRRGAGRRPRRVRRSTSRFRSARGSVAVRATPRRCFAALAPRFANTISDPALAAIAVRLGADVPFFLDPRPAWVTGIGEQIEPIPEFPAARRCCSSRPRRRWRPPRSFAPLDAALTPRSPSRRMPALRGGPGWSPSAALLANDLEPVATRLRPGIERVRSELGGSAHGRSRCQAAGLRCSACFATRDRPRSASREGRFEATDRVLVTRSHAAPTGGILGRRLMVGQRPLEPCVEVRILPPQPDDFLPPPDGGAGLEGFVPPPDGGAPTRVRAWSPEGFEVGDAANEALSWQCESGPRCFRGRLSGCADGAGAGHDLQRRRDPVRDRGERPRSRLLRRAVHQHTRPTAT